MRGDGGVADILGVWDLLKLGGVCDVFIWECEFLLMGVSLLPFLCVCICVCTYFIYIYTLLICKSTGSRINIFPSK